MNARLFDLIKHDIDIQEYFLLLFGGSRGTKSPSNTPPVNDGYAPGVLRHRSLTPSSLVNRSYKCNCLVINLMYCWS